MEGTTEFKDRPEAVLFSRKGPFSLLVSPSQPHSYPHPPCIAHAPSFALVPQEKLVYDKTIIMFIMGFFFFFPLEEIKTVLPKNSAHLPTLREPSGAWEETALTGPGVKKSGSKA